MPFYNKILCDQICSHFYTVFSSLFLSHKVKNKSPGGFEKWTFLKMSKNENPKKDLKTPYFSRF
jgi:hypothetical protein